MSATANSPGFDEPEKSLSCSGVVIERVASKTRSLWDKAVEMLSESDKAHIDFGQANKLAILDEVLVAVEDKKNLCLQKRWKYKRANGDVVILRDVVEKIVTWVDKFKKVGDVAVQYDPTHAGLPWAGVRFFLQMVINDTQIFGSMLEGIELVANLITRYSIFEALYLQTKTWATDQLTMNLVRLYTAILNYLAKARRYYGQSTSKRVASSLLQSVGSVEEHLKKISEEQAIVDACARLVDAELRQNTYKGVEDLRGNLVLLSLESRERLKRLQSDLEKPINRMADQLSDIHDSLKKSERLKIFQWMSTIPHRIHHKTMVKNVLPGSGGWLFRKPEFLEWRKSSVSSTLWLHGIPGSGKSKLTSLVVERFMEESSAISLSTPISYFYCVRNPAEPQRSDPDEILRSILKQLSSSKADLPIRKPVVRVYEQMKEEAEEDGCDLSKLMLDECVDLILELTENNPAVIVIDALDECDASRRHELLMALDKIIQESSNLVKVFVSSRDDNDIVCRLNNVPNVYIRACDNGEDIERFVQTEVEKAIKEKRLLHGMVSTDLVKRVVTTLIDGAKGMFRWVSLQIQNLCNPQRMKIEEDIIHELGRLPKTLGDLYALVYDQIYQSGPDSHAVAGRALKWLLCAQRPLLTREFIAAVSVDSDGVSIKLSNIDLLNMCCNLVVLDAELDVFRFAHASVQEYLESRCDYQESEVHALAAERCVDTYIERSPNRLSELAVAQNSALESYATLYWPVHCQKAGSDHLVGRLREKLRRFIFESGGVSPAFRKWTSTAVDLSRSLEWEDPLKARLHAAYTSAPTPLLLACCFELLPILDDLSTFRDTDWNQRNENKETGLHLAAKNGSVTVARLMVEKGVDVGAKDGWNWPALHRAARSGHPGVMRVLVEKGADIEARDGWGRQAIQQAAKYGQDAAVRALIEEGADIEGRDKWGRTALHQSAEFKHEAVAWLLLEKGAIVDVKDTGGCTPLHSAAEYGCGPVVQLLVDKGADVKARDLGGQTALHWAAKSGHEATVRLLLERGADVKATTVDGQTALHWAAKSGRESTARFLIEKGADINAKDTEGQTALHSAMDGGSEAVVQLLVESGADIEAKDKWRRTALQCASKNGREAMVRLLIEKGAHVENITGVKITSPDILPARTPSHGVLPGSSLAATSCSPSHQRLYFQDCDGGIHEARCENGVWRSGVDDDNLLFKARIGSPLAAVSWNGGDEIRVYYLSENNILQEYCYSATSGWQHGAMNDRKVQAAPDSDITAIQWSNSSEIRIYCQESSSPAIQEYTYTSSSQVWTRGITLSLALPGTRLSAVTWSDNGIHIRIYYQDEHCNLRELAWDDDWYVGQFSPGPCPPKSPILALLWPSPLQLRVYWQDASKSLVEMGWLVRWNPYPRKVIDVVGDGGIAGVEKEKGGEDRIWLLSIGERGGVEEVEGGRKGLSRGKVVG